MSTANYLEAKDGAKIYYEDHGDGRPILLVHGWLCSSKFWQKNMPELANEFRVVTLDLRGHGSSAKTLAGQAPHGRFIAFEDVGHILFYEQSQKFNAELAGFVKAL